MNILHRLNPSDSLVKKHLTQRLHQELKKLRTRHGFTLSRAVASGIKNLDSSIGIYAGDEEFYSLFAPLLDPIISDYHRNTGGQAASNFTVPDISNPDPDGRYILSTRIRLARNLKGFSFPCHIPLSERRKLEEKVTASLMALPKELEGRYHAFESSPSSLLSQLEAAKLSFKKGDRFQDAAGFNRDFPKARGVFHSNDKELIIWVNEEDHLRIISMKKSADLKMVFKKTGHAVKALSSRFEFACDPVLGFLTSCPTNIGTTMRAGVHIRLEKLDKNRPLLNRLVKKHHLQIRGTGGEKTRVDQAVFDISNKRRFGPSESDIIQGLHAGLTAIIKAEHSL